MSDIKHPSDLVVQRIDELLKDDSLNTRAGLKLVMSAFREGLILMSAVEARQNVVEQAYIRFANIESEAREEMKIMRDAVDKMLPVYKVMIWAGGIIGVALLMLLWQVFTGQVSINFR